MLVIYLKEGRNLYIGDSIKLIFKEFKDGHLKVLIDAPRDIKIDRYPNHPDRQGASHPRKQPPERSQLKKMDEFEDESDQYYNDRQKDEKNYNY